MRRTTSSDRFLPVNAGPLLLAAGLLVAAPDLLRAQDDLFGAGTGGQEPEPWQPPTIPDYDPEDVVHLGVRYVDLVEGSGTELVEDALCVFNYTGWLADSGTVFDSTLQPDRMPFATPIPGRLIEGWNTGLFDMNVGGTRLLMVPSHLGYGARGTSRIPAHSDLVFQVELLDVVPRPDIDPAGANEAEDGAIWTTLREGEGSIPFEEGGFGECHIVVWNGEGEYVGSSRTSPETLPVASDDDRYWVKYALGMTAGGRRAIEFEDPRPEQMRNANPTGGTDSNEGEGDGEGDDSEPGRWSMVIDMLDVVAPIVMPEHAETDEYDLGDGLIAIDLEIGDGEPMPEGAIPRIHYAGWLEDGTLFDSTRKPGREPIYVSPGLVIKGWELGLEGMNLGGRRKLIVPPELGYGERGNPRSGIPADATLIFEVELLGYEMPLFQPVEGGGFFGDG